MKKYLFSLVVRVICLLFSIGFTFYITKLFDVENASLFFKYITFVSIVSVFVKFGMDDFIVKKISSGECSGCILSFMINVFTLLTLNTLLIFVLYKYIDLNLLKNDNSLFLSIYAYSLVFLLSRFYQAFNKINYYMVMQNAIPVMLIVIFHSFFNISIYSSFYLSYFIVFIFFIFFIFFNIELGKFSFQLLIDFRMCKKLFSISLISSFMNWYGNIMYVFLKDDLFIAQFHLANRITSSLSNILTVASSIYYPKLIFLKKNNMPEMIRLYKFINRMLLKFAIVSVGILFFCSDYLLIIVGEEYKLAVVIIRILLVGQFINLACGMTNNMLISLDRELNFIVIALISIGLSLLSMLIFYNFYPNLSVAISSSIMIICVNCFSYFKINSILRNIKI